MDYSFIFCYGYKFILFIVDNSLDDFFLFTVCYSLIEAFAKFLWDNWSSYV